MCEGGGEQEGRNVMKVSRAHEGKARFSVAPGELLEKCVTKIIECLLTPPEPYSASIFVHPDLLGARILAGADKVRLRVKRIVKVEQGELHG